MRCRTNFWAIAILLALLLALAEFAVAQGTTIPAPGSQPSGLAFDGTFLFVSTASGFRTIFKLDPATGAVLDSFLAPSPTGFDGRGNPSDMVSDGASRLFVSDIGNFGAGIVREIDSAGTTTFNSFSLPFRGGAIAFDGTKLFNADFDSSEILVTDRSGTPIRTFVTGLRPAGMVFDPATGHLWVISQFDKTISEITTQGDLIRQCDGPRNPGIQGLGAVTLVAQKLYIAEVSDPDPFNPPDIPGTIFIVDPRSLTCDPPLVLTVTIDIKPGGDPNAINPANAGLIPVAILTTDTFDATTVSPITVQFGPAGASLEHKLGHLKDVDGDGDLDLVLHFRTQETGILCDDTEASLSGQTFDGGPFQASDSIVTVGCS